MCCQLVIILTAAVLLSHFHSSGSNFQFQHFRCLHFHSAYCNRIAVNAEEWDTYNYRPHKLSELLTGIRQCANDVGDMSDIVLFTLE